MKQKSNKHQKILIIIFLVVIGFLLMPIKQSCKVPGYSCAYLGDNGEVCYVYDLQPIFISILEGYFSEDLSFKFKTDEMCYQSF